MISALEQLGENMAQTIDEVIISALRSGLPLKEVPTVIISKQDKLEKLKNPQCASDYGLSMTIDELSTFEEGREFLAEMDQMIIYQRKTIYKNL